MPSSATSPALPAQLETLVQGFRRAKADARRLLGGSRQEQLSRRPAPNRWSALECVGHLNLGNNLMLSAIKQAIAQGRQLPNTPNPKYKMDLVDGPANRDIIVTSQEVRVVIDPKSALFVSGSVLDFSDDLQKGGFKVTNPNAEAHCSCGESFSA